MGEALGEVIEEAYVLLQVYETQAIVVCRLPNGNRQDYRIVSTRFVGHLICEELRLPRCRAGKDLRVVHRYHGLRENAHGRYQRGRGFVSVAQALTRPARDFGQQMS